MQDGKFAGSWMLAVVQRHSLDPRCDWPWIPACAGMTTVAIELRSTANLEIRMSAFLPDIAQGGP